jgi:cysteine peptidase B
MKGVLIVLLGISCLLAIAAAIGTTDPIRQEFLEYTQRYNKQYGSREEYERRLSIYQANVEGIKAKNSRSKFATFAVNEFTDMTKDEFKARYLMTDLPPLESGPVAANLSVRAPTSFDWRSRNPPVVTPVYNQGQCGSCWAFSATENIESRWALAGHTLTELSMQQIVDCDTTDAGCGGGWPYNAYQYVIGAGGMDPLADYPYVAENEQCAFNSGEVVAKISSWEYVTQSQDENQMASYLSTKGPLSVCVDASEWSSYSGGVFTADECTTSIDHCVQALGYNLNANPPYWIIRNSWGTSWGINGFMYLQFGQDACAVAEVVTSSIV